MNNDNKLIPQYRFLEFKDDGNWRYINIKSIASITIGEFVIKSKQNPNGLYPVYNGGRSYTGFYDEYNNTENKIVISARGANAGFVNLVRQKFWGGNSCYAIDILNKEKYNLDYVYYLIKHNQRLFTENQHAANIPSVSKTDVEKFKILLPSNPAEQQKIAACLSSLDDAIAGYQEKLTVLEEHKKGLMQNLFPQEDETQPKYRFPEFENDGDWVDKRLGELGAPLMCKRIFKEETTVSKDGNIPFFKIGTFGKEPDAFISVEKFKDYKSRFSFPQKGDILISASGTIGRLVVYDGAPAYFQDSNIIWLGHDEDVIKNKFLLYVYETLKWQTSDGGIIRRLYNSDFKQMKIKFPKNIEEQKKIAGVLSSVDQLIGSQREKIGALNEHKKGLMQGLFPKVDN